MYVLITEDVVSLSEVKVMSSLRDLNNIKNDIDVLVYHSSVEKSECAVAVLSSLKDKVKTFLYVRNSASVDVAVKIMLMGLGGRYFDDEYFLESEENLLSLINSLDNITELAELGGVDVLSDFTNRYLRDGSNSFTKAYIEVVKDAVMSIVNEVKEKNVELVSLAETSTEIFLSMSKAIRGAKTELTNLQEGANTLQKMLDSGAVVAGERKRDKRVNYSIGFFPSITHYSNKDMVCVKALGGVQYLVSYFLGLRLYLESVKKVRPKLVIICGIGDYYLKKYSDFDWCDLEDLGDTKKGRKEVVFTSHPSMEIMSRLLDDPNYDTMIVVDMITTSVKHILEGNKYPILYASNSKSSLDKFGIKKDRRILSVIEDDFSLFSIQSFIDYPEAKTLRERMYLDKCGHSYEILGVL